MCKAEKCRYTSEYPPVSKLDRNTNSAWLSLTPSLYHVAAFFAQIKTDFSAGPSYPTNVAAFGGTWENHCYICLHIFTVQWSCAENLYLHCVQSGMVLRPDN